MNHRGPNRNWRTALAAIDPATARAPVTLHAAQQLMAHGFNAYAETALREFLDHSPNNRTALVTLGMLLRRVGRAEEAAELLVRAARSEAEQIAIPAGESLAVEQFFSAADQCGPPPAEAPAAYVTALFDESAERFETLLRGNLEYRGPELLLETVSKLAGDALRDLDVLDLGCGTGLAGELFRSAARRLDGVDLSPKMLEQAAAKGIYDRLIAGDIVAYLNQVDDRYDLILAADVFVYVGDLLPVLAAAHKALRSGGRLAFTVEACDGDSFFLQPIRRYAHSQEYVTRTATAMGFAIESLEQSSIRMQSFHPVRSFVCVLIRTHDSH